MILHQRTPPHEASDGRDDADVAFYGEVLGAMAWNDGLQTWPGHGGVPDFHQKTMGKAMKKTRMEPRDSWNFEYSCASF